MIKRKLKLLAVPLFYGLVVAVFITSMFLMGKLFSKEHFKNNEKIEYVDKEIINDNEYIPVVNIPPTMMKPFLNENVNINKKFYDNNAESTAQEEAIILYENTYIQNSGIDYKYQEQFDIISVLDGTVIDVNENEILGNTIKIRHNNDIISTYQCLSEPMIKKDDTVIRGQIIAKSGTCKLYGESNNLHFEISKQGQNLNPETSYNKTEDEL